MTILITQLKFKKEARKKKCYHCKKSIEQKITDTEFRRHLHVCDKCWHESHLKLGGKTNEKKKSSFGRRV